MDFLSDEQKIYELSRIWKDAEYNFAFWDKVTIDWDEEYRKALPLVLATQDTYEYYRELTRFLALLGDGHTGVTPPMEMMQSAEYYSMFPVYLAWFEKDIVIVCVSEELKEEIPLFSVVKAIDGVEISQYIQKECYPYIWHTNEDACGNDVIKELLYGRAESKAVFTLEKYDNRFDVKLKRQDALGIKWSASGFFGSKYIERQVILDDESCKLEMTADGIAVLKLTTFMDESVPGKIYGKFDELRTAKGYLIDVRGNGGGDSNNANAIAAMFIDGGFESCAAETQLYEPTFKAWGMFRDDFRDVTPDRLSEVDWDDWSHKCYKMCRHIFFQKEKDTVENRAPGHLEGPIVVLMNEYTVSAAEDFVDVMKQYTDAVFVGNNTAGTSGQPYCVSLESGGSYRICTRRCIAQNGEDIYNKGFSPDIRIVRSLPDYINGCDKAMENGIEIIKGRL